MFLFSPTLLLYKLPPIPPFNIFLSVQYTLLHVLPPLNGAGGIYKMGWRQSKEGGSLS